MNGLPDELFAGLSDLQQLLLANNELTTLPSRLFSGLTSLQELMLNRNELRTLPDSLFSGLPQLNTLNLSSNRLRQLPKGIFIGLSMLETLDLSRNLLDPIPLQVSIDHVADGEFKAIAPTAAPFNLTLPVSVTGPGTIETGVTMTTIPSGALESQTVLVTRDAGAEEAIFANVGAVPSLPAKHAGYELVKDESLPRLVMSSTSVSDSTLARVSLSKGKLSPVFSAGTENYIASVPFSASVVTVKTTSTNADAEVAFLDSENRMQEDTDANTEGHQVTLGLGENTLRIKVHGCGWRNHTHLYACRHTRGKLLWSYRAGRSIGFGGN